MCFVIPVKTGIQKKVNTWIPAGVYPGESRGRNDSKHTALIKKHTELMKYSNPPGERNIHSLGKS